MPLVNRRNPFNIIHIALSAMHQLFIINGLQRLLATNGMKLAEAVQHVSWQQRIESER